MGVADGPDEPAGRREDHAIRAAELVGALSLATDLGTGQPLEHALRTAVLAVRLGELAGASSEEPADTYYVALLHASGCTSNGHEATLLFGEDIEHRARLFPDRSGRPGAGARLLPDPCGAGPSAGRTRADGRVSALRSCEARDRVWAIFDWDLEGWAAFASDPEVPSIMQEAGHTSRPQVTELVGRFDA
jgi:hypothetical protein